MAKEQAFKKNNIRSSYFVILAAMCLAILFIIAMAFKNNILRDGVALTNTLIDILGLIFLILLYGFSFSRSRWARKAENAFKLLVIHIFVYVFFSGLANSFYSMPDHVIALTVLVSLDYGIAGFIYLTIWTYQRQFIQESKSSRIFTIMLAAAPLFYIGVIILNFFRPVLFYITQQGVFDKNIIDYPSFVLNAFCIIVLLSSLIHSEMTMKKKLSFAGFILVPVVITLLNLLHDVLGWNLFLTSVISIALILLLYNIFFNIHLELENELIKKESEQMKLQLSAAISQIQPHFVYNSLSVIAALCEENPKLAAEAANTFSDYLRENVEFAGKHRSVTFAEELKHIKTYVWLEQLRFPNKLKIEYDIKCDDFYVPALSVQPLVENAIKHGICKTRTGGTVRIGTFEDKAFYVVTVSDNGAGFDTAMPIKDGKQHVGIENAGFRIKEMFGGSLDVVSTPGNGTTVTIKIPKGL